MSNSILLFDGKLKHINAFQAYLVNEGIHPIFALTTQEVIQKVEKYSPSLIMINCLEPDLNLLKMDNILEVNDGYSDIPIVFVSTLAHKNDTDSQIKGFTEIIIEEQSQEKFMSDVKQIVSKYFPDLHQEKILRILVAEDDPVIQNTVRLLLRKDGYKNIRSAQNGKEAWDEFQQYTPDLLILDYMMPFLNGFELLNKIRSNYEYNSIPIIFLTALSDKGKLTEALNAGATDYITKPFDQSELLARVKTHARNYYLQKQLFTLNQHLGNVNKELSLKNAQIEADLRSARKIQESLLPKETPNLTEIKINFFYQPSQSIGGDFLNYFQLDADHIGFYITDVSGHGVTSAMITVFVREQVSNILKNYQLNKLTPASILNQLNINYNKEIYFLDNGVYFTIFFGILNIRSKILYYASAGHHAFPIIFNNNHLKEIKKTELAIGFLEDYNYTDHHIQLKKNDRIFLHTDGIIEICNKNNELFGMERLKNFLSENLNRNGKTVLKDLVRTGENFSERTEQNDDIALMLIDIE